MTNRERWDLLMRDVFAPPLFKEWGFYFTIAAALRRRVVVMSNDSYPIMANQFVVLVGPPGAGKGLVTNQVLNLLRITVESKLNVSQQIAAIAAAAAPTAKPTLFNLAPDSITYEACMCLLNSGVQRYKDAAGNAQWESAATFVLDEITSIFADGGEKLRDAMLTLWTGRDFRNETKNKGNDYVARPVVNLIGGTTPEVLRRVTGNSLIDTGMAARMIFVYSDVIGRRRSFIPPLDADQVKAAAELQDHLRMLSELVWAARLSPQAIEYVDEAMNSPAWRKNDAVELDDYYTRKALHVWKLALAHRMSEADWNRGELMVSEVQHALDILERTERTMHIPLRTTARNQLQPIANRILQFIQICGTRGTTLVDLNTRFYESAATQEINQILLDLIMMHKITFSEGRYYATRQS